MGLLADRWSDLPELTPLRAQHGCGLVELGGRKGVIVVGGDSGGTRLSDVRLAVRKLIFNQMMWYYVNYKNVQIFKYGVSKAYTVRKDHVRYMKNIID